MSSRAQELADAARKLPFAERTSFLAQACGADQELLDQVKSLVTSSTDSTDEAQWMKQTRDAGFQAGNAAQPTEVDSRLGSSEPATATSQSLERGTALGRYVVLNQLGSGGMGVVYAAYDPEMNRKVAIKLLRADVAGKLKAEVARARLLREAQAMARLSHPNIVPVHDVGTFGSQVFIVMEYVEGQTLKRWLDEKRPSTKEIVATFLHAGRALAAAHAVQLIHRDFKLDNVLVAADGRVLVTDFGLATAAREAEVSAPVSTSQPLLDTAMTPREDVFGAMLTQTGSILGTPAYMAPEQLLGQRTDARVDQFSFCVALYEALYGERPFAGERLDALVREVTAGNVREPPKSSRVPGWLRQILLRGLKTNAGERYPSMETLLADLEKDPAIARRRWLYAAGVAAVIVVPLIGYRQIKHQQSQLCKGAENELAGIWNDETRAGVSRAFLATGKPYAQTAVANVGKALDRYSRDWAAMFTQACEATRLHGTQSEELLDLRMQCLSRRRAGFQSLIEIFASADAKVVERSVDAAQSLAPLEGCADVAALKAPVRPPADPAVRAKVDELRRKLATANAMHAAGKYREGVTLAGQIVSEAKALQYRPLEAEALDQLGRMQQGSGDRKAANQTFKEAVVAAEAGRHDEIAAKAWAALVPSNRTLGRYEDAREAGKHAEAALERIGAKDKPLIELLMQMGTLFADQHKFDEAFAYYQRAQSIRDKISVEPSFNDLNYLGWATTGRGRPEEGLQYQRRALALGEQTLGPDHPHVGDLLSQMGRTLYLMGKYEESLDRENRALAIQEKTLGPQHPQVALTMVAIGRALRALGRQDDAFDYFRRSLALYEEVLGPDHWELANPLEDIGSVLASRGEYAPAISNFERALALVEKAFGPDNPLVASLLMKIGGAALGLRDNRKAIGSLERALSIREKHPEGPTDLAETRFALARALKKSGRDRQRAMTLAANAREAYVAAGDKYKKNVAEVDGWVAGKQLPNPWVRDPPSRQ